MGFDCDLVKKAECDKVTLTPHPFHDDWDHTVFDFQVLVKAIQLFHHHQVFQFSIREFEGARRDLLRSQELPHRAEVIVRAFDHVWGSFF